MLFLFLFLWGRVPVLFLHHFQKPMPVESTLWNWLKKLGANSEVMLGKRRGQQGGAGEKQAKGERDYP